MRKVFQITNQNFADLYFINDHWKITTVNKRKMQNKLVKSMVARYILVGWLFKCYDYFQIFQNFIL